MEETTLDRTAMNLLKLLFFHHNQIFKSSDGICGVKIAQFRILGLLAKKGTMSMSTLGNRLFISKPYMTNLVDALIRDGYVQRQPDPNDRRVINIAITEEGIRHIENGMDMYKESVKGIISQLDTSDLVTLCNAVENVAEILTKITDTPTGIISPLKNASQQSMIEPTPGKTTAQREAT